MPSVPLSYAIGIVGLLAVLATVTLISLTVGSSLATASTKSSLTDAAQYVAQELNTVIVASMNSINETIAYRLVMPQQVNTNGYAINITYNSQGWAVVAYIPGRPSVNGFSRLTFQTSGPANKIGVCYYIPNNNIANCPSPGPSITPLAVIYSGDQYAVVWARVSNNQVTAGLGDMPH